MASSSSFSIPITVHGKTRSTETMDNGEEKERENTLQELPFYNEDNFTDVILLVQGQPLFTNRSLLAYASPVFSCMFTDAFKEKDEKQITLPNKDYASISDMLSFLHPGVEFTLTIESAFRLLPLADEYQISVLKNACEDVLLRELRDQIYPTTEYVLKCMECAEKGSLPNLIEKCTEVFSDPDVPLKELKESQDISLENKAKVYESRIKKMENEREITESWKHRIVSVRQRLKDIILPHDDHCRCRTEIKLRSAVQRTCPYCSRTWCSDNISTDSYRNSYWFFCNHKIGYHISHDATIRTFLDMEDI